MALNPGTRLGPYEVGEQIGAGGMGEVYRARDPRLGRDVAIKIIAAAPDSDLLARFERETRATAVLAHPNILTIFDVGTHDGLPFLVSELLDGQTLGRKLAAGPLEPARVVELALQLVRGVAAAHALRIVHRDLKPENLFVTGRGTLKILDFGLAKLKSSEYGDPAMSTIETSDPSKLIGTPAYMAPEQLRGQLVDERADIFAIGTVLYEMVSGRHPFRRESPVGTLSAILHDAPPALEPTSPYPSSMERVLRHCLEKDPADRFQTAGDLAFALESIMGELRQPAADVPTSREPQSTSSIAVLPFADMSPTRDQAYLCEGIAEELINVLARVPGLRVAARSSSFQFRASAVDVRAVGARLGVATVLEGGVRKAGDRLRVTVQLVDVADGYQRWSHRFDGKLEDVFAIQDEIAERVAVALGSLLTDHEREALRRPETAPETYEFFLRGRQLVNQSRGQSFMMAKQMFEQAIERDPQYAPAYAGLADVHAWFYTWWGGSDADYDAADRASRKALELASDLSEAHTSRGFVLSLVHKYEESEREFHEALRLNPLSFEAHYIYARMCFGWGRIQRSAELFRRAADVRPEDFQCLMLGSQALAMLGKKAEAAEANREGIRRAERQLELDPVDIRALSLGSGALFVAGQHDRAEQWITRALEIAPEDGGVLANAACFYAKAGRVEEALDVLEKTFARGWGKRDWIEQDPDYDPLRSHPRFKAMLAKLK
ncbi:MAG TPA: protein kinase [Vicinamibacterales bacterium]|nr:protein kinase [Vicinamibacterales bacterium]